MSKVTSQGERVNLPWSLTGRQGGQAELQRESAGGEPERIDRKCGSVRSQWDSGARRSAGHAGAIPGTKPVTAGGTRDMTRRISWPSVAICGSRPGGAKPSAERRERDRCAYHTPRGLCHQPTEEEAHRRVFRVAEDDRAAAESASSRDFQGGLGIHLRLCRLQPGAHAEPEPSAGSTRLSRGKPASPGLGIRLPTQPTVSCSTSARETLEIRRAHQFFSSLLEFWVALADKVIGNDAKGVECRRVPS